jgi:hypothetical protein
MVVFPEDKPVIRNIHASYVDMAKLVAYYQQQMDSGCIHLQAAHAEGVLFFNRQGIVNSHFSDQGRQLDGQAAQDQVMQPSGDTQIHVYDIPAEQQAFWSQMQSAVAIHTNLSTEFTDLVKLLKKMAVEKLTGYIDVKLAQPGDEGRIFLVEGKFIGGTYTWSTGRLLPGKEDLESLIRKTAQAEGTFNVFSIASSAPSAKTEEVPAPPPPPVGDLEALAQLLALFEQMVSESRSTKGDFQTHLKKKFVQNVDRYAFLDPFAAEFDYHDGAITFNGNVEEAQLAEGVLTALAALADDLDLRRLVPPRLKAWQENFEDKFSRWGLAGYFPVAG